MSRPVWPFLTFGCVGGGVINGIGPVVAGVSGLCPGLVALLPGAACWVKRL
jgi:hypothetical protein